MLFTFAVERQQGVFNVFPQAWSMGRFLEMSSKLQAFAPCSEHFQKESDMLGKERN